MVEAGLYCCEEARCTFSIRAVAVKSNVCDSTSGCPELSFTLLGMEHKTPKMIAELANKIVRLTREVPLKCEDVAVSISEDEGEYLEGCWEQPKKTQEAYTFEQQMAPMQQSTENNNNYPINLCIKKEPYEEFHHSTEQPTVQESTEKNYPINLCIKEEPGEEPHLFTDGTSALLSTVNVQIPFEEAQSASGFTYISSFGIKSEPGGESSGDTEDSADEESPQAPRSHDRKHVYNIISRIKEEAEKSKDSDMSVYEDTVSQADCIDQDYLPSEPKNKRARTQKSRSREPSSPCEVCGKVFSNKWTLVKHMKIHSGERPFSCDECDKTYKCKSHLTSHMRTHTGERPYKCNQCSRRFFNHQHLVLHQVVHTGEKPYSCPVCGKGFTRQSSVVKHSGMHAEQKRHVCSECGKSYCQYASLIVHLRQHSGEKPFVCKYCEEAFSLKDAMLRHQKTHTG
ncbi:uncharacterized protein LOC143979427 [Lithobates pipiens]